jgi:hypothetical protein
MCVRKKEAITRVNGVARSTKPTRVVVNCMGAIANEFELDEILRL